MKNTRVALVGSSHQILWKSCQSISNNLIKSYQGLEQDMTLQFFSFRQHPKVLIEDLLKFKPDRLVFFDHNPEYLPMLDVLRDSFAMNPPTLVIHVYGDFTFYLDRWIEAGKSLKRWKIHFLCASPKYLRFFRQFVERDCTMSLCPFPVDTDAFPFDAKVRAETRRRLGIAADEKVWIYSGRISIQKNVDRLLQEFSISLQSNSKQRLILLGEYDDIGLNFVGLRAPLGYTYQYFRKFTANLPVGAQKKILHLSENSAQEIHQAYLAADALCSFSLFHDEDFGMAPAEALCTGLPVVLTNWGGYSQFAQKNLPCKTIPLHYNGRGYSFTSEDFQKIIAVQGVQGEGQLRLTTAKNFESTFGIKAVTDILKESLSTTPQIFPGLSEESGIFWKTMRHSPDYPLQQTFYEHIYAALAAR